MTVKKSSSLTFLLHFQDTVFQLQRLVGTLQRLHEDSIEILKNLQHKFPVEIELSRVAGVIQKVDDYEDDDDDKNEQAEDEKLHGRIFEPKPVTDGENGVHPQTADDLLLDLG